MPMAISRSYDADLVVSRGIKMQTLEQVVDMLQGEKGQIQLVLFGLELLEDPKHQLAALTDSDIKQLKRFLQMRSLPHVEVIQTPEEWR